MAAQKPEALDEVQPASSGSRPSDIDVEKEPGTESQVHTRQATDELAFDSDGNSDFQEGVQRVRAITTIWSKWTLITMFVLLYLISFIDFLQNAIDSALNPYVTSSFGSHGLLNIGSILSSIVGAVAPLALAKVIDIWGRVEGFIVMIIVCVAGMIIKAVCRNVEQYVAAHVLYWTGHIGMMYVIEVMISDMTSLRNRAFMIAINGTPRIASTFAGPAIAQAFYENLNFRWAFGAFAIILVGCSIPAMGFMIFMAQKAKRAGLMVHRSRNRDRKWYQSIKHYAIELDLLGIIIIAGALSCLLLPFSLVAYAPNGWTTPYIIAMLVLGVVLFPAFYAYEAFLAPVQFLPFRYLKQGTIIGSALLYGVMFLSTFCWNGYYGSYLQVVNRLSIRNSNYVLNSYSLTSTVIAPLVGAIISWTGDFKWTAMTGVPIMLIGTAIIIPLRTPDTNAGLLAFTQILVGLGSGIFTVCSSIAIMAPVTHQYIAVVNALSGLFGGVGAAIGLAIAGSLWNNLLPQQLEQRLPQELKSNATTIFGDIVLQMSFADGTPERQAIVDSYAYVMRLMVIAGACFMPLCLLSIFVWKNINVRKIEEEKGKQTKGTVF
ncbi:siderophore iron transporter-like protein mirB [Stachybotrys elegans]|uniref:Siderophore iron transporter-like protein mirB n=1 Tax=Stachybotrys elegans TaxID=80388 RepID=A0A8K0SLQ9_9HYPO|nr:siderophore iron transporter-like protein mirB [Stachybotrys elegans]